MNPTRVTIPVNPLDMSEGVVEVEAYDAAVAYNSYYVRTRRELHLRTVQLQQHQTEITRLQMEAALPARRWGLWACLGFVLGFASGRLPW